MPGRSNRIARRRVSVTLLAWETCVSGDGVTYGISLVVSECGLLRIGTAHVSETPTSVLLWTWSVVL